MLLGIVQIEGHSMLPTLSPGQLVLVSSLPYLFSNPRIGDIVVFTHPKENILYIKRLKKIIDEKYFVVGDNHVDSHDSREFGFIERKDIVGKVIKKL